MSVPFTPCGQRVLVVAEEQGDLIKGVYLSSEVPSTHGHIVAIGPQVLWFHEGDHIAFHHFSGTKMSIDGTKYMLLSVSDILMILPEVADVAVGAV